MSRPPLWSTRNPELGTLQDAIESTDRVNPALAVELRAHSMATRAEARKTKGSADGNGGPRMMMLAGYEDPGDGGEGVFYWDNTSTTADDEGVTTLAVFGVASGRWKRAQLYPSASTYTGRLIGAPRVLTSGTTYTPTAGTRSILVELVGGGGGGGGAVNATAAQMSMGEGGSSGSYARKWYATIPASCTYAIGAAGTAGANTGGNGGTGGNTTFTDGTTLVTAVGGNGGRGSTPSGSLSGAGVYVGQAAAGAAISTNGDLNQGGNPGGTSIRLSGTVGNSGNGGGSVFAGAGQGRISQGPGVAAIANSGSGGSGAVSINAGGGEIGGLGGAGAIVVWEFT